jgi:hypothetical protein
MSNLSKSLKIGYKKTKIMKRVGGEEEEEDFVVPRPGPTMLRLVNPGGNFVARGKKNLKKLDLATSSHLVKTEIRKEQEERRRKKKERKIRGLP